MIRSPAMQQGWRQSILYRAVVAVVGSAMLVGILFIGITASLTNDRAQQQSQTRLTELLETVEDTVSIACFVEDKSLATEVAHGLLKNGEVLGVVIRSRSGELVKRYRTDAPKLDAERVKRGRQTRKIMSPFNREEVIGEIVLDPDPDSFDRYIGQEVRFVGFLLWIQLGGVVLAIVVVMLRLIVRPIKGMSDQLHHMDATRGDRLSVPPGHSGTEVGRLADDINGLADQLVTSLEDERGLRLLREIDEKKYRAIFDNAETGIFIADRLGRIESRNPALARFVELPAEAAGDEIMLYQLPWNEQQRLSQTVSDCIDDNVVCAGDFEFTRLDSSICWLNVLLSPIGGEHVQGVVVDVTERKLAEDSAKRQAITDPLTGAANRTGFEQKVLTLIRQGDGQAGARFCLMLVNLDGFKPVNDALGLPVGDLVLKHAVERLQSSLKTSDIVARVGGDEFALVLPLVRSEELAGSIGERIVRSLGRNYEVHSTPVQLGASIGITLYPNDGKDIPTLLRNAELALDRAKVSGGSRYSFFDPAMVEAAERRRALESDLQLALRLKQFRLFCQPIVDLPSNRLVGAEALIRWEHPQRGRVPPDAFIPVAEETGLIVELGLWIVEEACRQLIAWRDAGRDWYLSINISGRQIPDGLTPAKIAEVVQQFGVDPHRLVLEITEGVLLADVNKALDWLTQVRALGFGLYLDDFGTGYSSLSYLKRFPVDTVKIDKSFVHDMGVNQSDRALVAAIIAMAQSLGLQVVAEGVEDETQLNLLRDMGCRRVQGYYFSKPVAAEEFDEVASRIEGMLK
jgi:diguanylate cyclase (GGDEF)-like protein/PAS domain S-box-containing protein